MRRVFVVLMLTAFVASAVPASGEDALVPKHYWDNHRVTDDAGVADEESPAIAFNATDNEFLTVWVDRRDVPRGADILARRIDNDGHNVGHVKRVSHRRSVGNEIEPAIAWNAARNEYLVVWQDDRLDGLRGSEVMARRVGVDGRGIGPDFSVARGRRGDQTLPDVTYDPTLDEYVVVWMDRRFGDRWSVFARRVSSDGIPIGPDIRITNRRKGAWSPAVEAGSGGRVLVVWGDDRQFRRRGRDVFGLLLGPARAIREEFRVSTEAALGSEHGPRLAFDETDDQWLVVWSDTRISEANSEIFGALVGSDGDPPADEIEISRRSHLGTFDRTPDVARTLYRQDKSMFAVVWSSARPRGWRVALQHVNGRGGLEQGEVGYHRAQYQGSEPAIAGDAFADYGIVWSDGRNAPARGTDIFSAVQGVGW